MEPVHEDLSLRVVGITAHWDLDVVRSAKVRTVYAALDLLCHLTAAEAKMSAMCVQIILETRMMSLVHHAPLWCRVRTSGACFSPGIWRQRTPSTKMPPNTKNFRRLAICEGDIRVWCRASAEARRPRAERSR